MEFFVWTVKKSLYSYRAVTRDVYIKLLTEIEEEAPTMKKTPTAQALETM